jgi:hypothetical protein
MSLSHPRFVSPLRKTGPPQRHWLSPRTTSARRAPEAEWLALSPDSDGAVIVVGVPQPLPELQRLHDVATSQSRTPVGLEVDSENETDSTRLYERAGMRVTRRYATFEKRLR